MSDEMLARLDERTQSIEKRLDEHAKNTEKVLDHIDNRLETHYVTFDSFNPVRTLVYGAVAFLLLTVGGSIVVAMVVGG